MPNVKSAEKRMRQNIKRRDRNRAIRGAFRTALKKADAALESGDVQAAEAEVQKTLKIIGKTEKKGAIHQHKAARHQSHLMQKLNSLKSGSSAEA